MKPHSTEMKTLVLNGKSFEAMVNVYCEQDLFYYRNGKCFRDSR